MRTSGHIIVALMVGPSWIATPALAFDGVPVNQDPAYANAGGDMLAFEYFSRIVNAHGEDSPTSPQALIVASAYVALGRYYLNGIPNSNVKADPDRPRELFDHAASYFGNADAQYELARMYLKAPDASPMISAMAYAGWDWPPRRANAMRRRC